MIINTANTNRHDDKEQGDMIFEEDELKMGDRNACGVSQDNKKQLVKLGAIKQQDIEKQSMNKQPIQQ